MIVVPCSSCNFSESDTSCSIPYKKWIILYGFEYNLEISLTSKFSLASKLFNIHSATPQMKTDIVQGRPGKGAFWNGVKNDLV